MRRCGNCLAKVSLAQDKQAAVLHSWRSGQRIDLGGETPRPRDPVSCRAADLALAMHGRLLCLYDALEAALIEVLKCRIRRPKDKTVSIRYQDASRFAE